MLKCFFKCVIPVEVGSLSHYLQGFDIFSMIFWSFWAGMMSTQALSLIVSVTKLAESINRWRTSSCQTESWHLKSFPRSSSCFPLDILYGSIKKLTNFFKTRSDCKTHFFKKEVSSKKSGGCTLPETNRHSPWKWMVSNRKLQTSRGSGDEVGQWPIYLGRRDSSWHYGCISGCPKNRKNENGEENGGTFPYEFFRKWEKHGRNKTVIFNGNFKVCKKMVGGILSQLMGVAIQALCLKKTLMSWENQSFVGKST